MESHAGRKFGDATNPRISDFVLGLARASFFGAVLLTLADQFYPESRAGPTYFQCAKKMFAIYALSSQNLFENLFNIYSIIYSIIPKCGNSQAILLPFGNRGNEKRISSFSHQHQRVGIA